MVVMTMMEEKRERERKKGIGRKRSGEVGKNEREGIRERGGGCGEEKGELEETAEPEELEEEEKGGRDHALHS